MSHTLDVIFSRDVDYSDFLFKIALPLSRCASHHVLGGTTGFVLSTARVAADPRIETSPRNPGQRMLEELEFCAEKLVLENMHKSCLGSFQWIC